MSDGTPDYLDLPVGRFLDLVASGESAPGGGSAAAVSVALAAGLSSMAARLSTEQLTDAATLAQRTENLRERVAPLARADAAAYGLVLAARRTPNTDDRVRSALSDAADVPLAVAEAGTEVAKIAARLASNGNPNLKGDAICALMLADAGVRASARLVEINLSDGRIEDGRLGRARQLVEIASFARRTVEGEV